MHERRFNSAIERLRDPERIARLESDRVIRLVLEGQGKIHSVLDCGTGSGIFAEQFAARGLRVTGLDAKQEMLSAASLYVPSGTFLEGVAEDLPFLDGSFDIIFMGLLLHETDDIHAAMCEAHRVAIKRVAILEWQYEEQPFGPPLEHRLSDEKIASIAKQLGFNKFTQQTLQSLILYLIDQ